MGLAEIVSICGIQKVGLLHLAQALQGACGGITGGSFHFGALFAIRLATGWDPATADVIVGTSSGAVVTAISRSGHLHLDRLIGDVEDDDAFAEGLAELIFHRTKVRGVGRWLRHGVWPGLRRPGVASRLRRRR